jgi:hypothetical protein
MRLEGTATGLSKCGYYPVQPWSCASSMRVINLFTTAAAHEEDPG